MTVLVTALTPEGVVMATDSRLIAMPINPGESKFVSSDLATKLYLFNNLNAGFSLAGPILLPDFALVDIVAKVEANTFSCIHEMVIFITQNLVTKTNMPFCFHLAGYEDGKHKLYKVKHDPPMPPRITTEEQQTIFADGDYDIIAIILHHLHSFGFTISGMTLLDAVDFVALLTQSQIQFSRFKGRLSPVGGPVDVLVITRDQAYFASRKVLRLLSPYVSRFRSTANCPS